MISLNKMVQRNGRPKQLGMAHLRRGETLHKYIHAPNTHVCSCRAVYGGKAINFLNGKKD